ncbi:hypothetical protein NECAME_15168 [Necator americanus]|uniref:UBA domain-containing protein n=1 Tax=Necator americanus TaxID=51031 RepID=W2SJC7_NECAM|nr:hypothetical protein NECAME_15168 [Necator americanus]ETN69668.1 hypothetical protein NECAME_15168 [Necator americanus]
MPNLISENQEESVEFGSEMSCGCESVTTSQLEIPTTGSIPLLRVHTLRNIPPNSLATMSSGCSAGIDADVRVGRHRDKLELIRDSLRPFEQTGSDAPTAAAEQTASHPELHSLVVDTAANSGIVEQQRAMVDNLVGQGYEQDAAFYALKLVKFVSTAAAIDVLKHINHDHANMEETKNLVFRTPYTADFYQPQVRSQQGNYKPSIYIERGSESYNEKWKLQIYRNQ